MGSMPGGEFRARWQVVFSAATAVESPQQRARVELARLNKDSLGQVCAARRGLLLEWFTARQQQIHPATADVIYPGG